MSELTYEEAVQWMRQQPESNNWVKDCYLDTDNITAAKRFANSEEFLAVKHFLKLSHRSQPCKILDLGCGNGIASYAFASLGHAVAAVDPDLSDDVGLSATARLVSTLGDGSIETVQAFAESLPFADATFDIVYARQSLHHFSDLNQGLSECARVLKPNGLLFATREHIVSDQQQLQAFLDSHILHQMHSGENAYQLDNYLLALHQSSFKVMKCFASYDTVINHFPLSNSDLKSWLFKALQNKLGKVGASVLARVPLIEEWYRHHLSQFDGTPGRLYSFLCVKQNRI